MGRTLITLNDMLFVNKVVGVVPDDGAWVLVIILDGSEGASAVLLYEVVGFVILGL